MTEPEQDNQPVALRVFLESDEPGVYRQWFSSPQAALDFLSHQANRNILILDRAAEWDDPESDTFVAAIPWSSIVSVEVS